EQRSITAPGHSPAPRRNITTPLAAGRLTTSRPFNSRGNQQTAAPPPLGTDSLFTAIWLDLRDSPTGCLATEREVEYCKRGCSVSRTRQLAGAMAFYDTKARSQLQGNTQLNPGVVLGSN
ncbi:hypothetical protein FQN60_000216, partial [Etheostoma spectabile]